MSQGFRKEIRLFDAVMLVSGTMIGSGIFIVSADIARSVGSTGYSLLVWLLAGVITMLGALSYGELSALMPQAGGQYIYLREAYGKLPAFLYGWTLFLVIQTGTIAAVAVAFAKFTGVLVPAFDTGQYLVDTTVFKISMQQGLAIVIIWLLTAFNIRGVRSGKLIQNIFGSTKILALILLVLVAIFLFSGEGFWQQNWSSAWQPQNIKGESLAGYALLAAFSGAMVGALFSSDAWNNVSFAGDEIINPHRTIPRALAIGTGLVMVIYIAMNLVYLYVLPLNGTENGAGVTDRGIMYASSDRVAVAAALSAGGNIAGLIITILIMVSTFSCVNGCILSGARVYYTMATDKLFFPPMARLNKKGTPGYALIFQAIWASLLCLSGSYGNLLDYVIFAVLLFYILTIAAIFVLRRKMPDAPRPYRAVGYPVLPALYILLATGVCIMLLLEKPAYTWPGFIIVALGIPVYAVFAYLNRAKASS